MHKKLTAVVVFTVALLGGAAAVADTAEAGVLYTGMVRAQAGDVIICSAVNMSSVRVPIKMELIDTGPTFGPNAIVDQNFIPAVEPGSAWGVGDPSEGWMRYDILEGQGGINAYCRFTVDGFPANFIRGVMIVRFGSRDPGGSISLDALPAPQLLPGRFDGIIGPIQPPIAR